MLAFLVLLAFEARCNLGVLNKAVIKGFPSGGKLSAKRTDEGRNIYESFVSIIPASNTKECLVKPTGQPAVIRQKYFYTNRLKNGEKTIIIKKR